MKNRSLVLTVSLIAMMIVGAAHGAQIASTDYVTKSVGDEADLVWTAIDSINNETTGILATANSYTDTEITAAMEEVADAIPTKVSDLPNDAGFITADQDKDTVYTLPAATADTLGGVMVDTEINSTSTNPVQNKAVSAALDGKLDTNGSIEIDQVTGLSDALANAGSQLNEAQTAAVNSGITQAKVEVYDAYAGQIASKADASALNDYATNQALTNGLAEKLGKDEKAASAATADSATTAETATKDASGNVITATYATKGELGGKMDKVTLATVATTGSYNDLLDKPTIPTDNAQLANGAGYITAAALPTKVSELTNDTGFITADQDKDTVYTLPAATADTLGGVMVDTEISSTSSNPVQNKAVSAALANKADASAIPTNNNQLTNGAGYLTSATLPGATASVAGIMKWGQIPSGSATSATAATIWVQ